MSDASSSASPHQGGQVLTAGAPLGQARAAMILIHGRGASAMDILSLAGEFDGPDVVFLAPQAAGHTWYPNRFLAPLESNEPYLSSALEVVDDLLGHLHGAGIGPERAILLGFSQGACLALEYAARYPQRYGGVVGLSGALIGPPDTPRTPTGSLDATPVFIGCSDIDPHVPLPYVEAAASHLRALGGQVDARVYPGMGHEVNADEIAAVQAMMSALTGQRG
ncbi:MAG: alpha/beta fold hydrolase [Anaerolineae bacterium]|nr:alpha/beta fold hydrolase [Anaerolineae bacterium]